MRLPPGVSSSEFAAVVAEFERAVGKQWVFTRDEDVDLYRDAFSPFLHEAEELVASAAVAPSTGCCEVIWPVEIFRMLTEACAPPHSLPQLRMYAVESSAENIPV